MFVKCSVIASGGRYLGCVTMSLGGEGIYKITTIPAGKALIRVVKWFIPLT
jgi:hypothetical protein